MIWLSILKYEGLCIKSMIDWEIIIERNWEDCFGMNWNRRKMIGYVCIYGWIRWVYVCVKVLIILMCYYFWISVFFLYSIFIVFLVFNYKIEIF